MSTRTGLPINHRSFVATLVACILIANSIESSAAENIVWINPTNVIVTGNSLLKSGCEYCNGSADSQQQIPDGSGYMEFTASELSTIRFAGLSNVNSGTGYAAINFAIRLGPWHPNSGIAEVRENNVYKWD